MSDLGVPPHLSLLFISQWPGLQQDKVVRADLADVMDTRRVANELDLRVLQPKTSRSVRASPLRASTRRCVSGVGVTNAYPASASAWPSLASGSTARDASTLTVGVTAGYRSGRRYTTPTDIRYTCVL